MDFTVKCVDEATQVPLSVMHHVSCSLHFVPISRLGGGGFHLPKIATNKCVYHSAESRSHRFPLLFPPFMQHRRHSDLACLRAANAV